MPNEPSHPSAAQTVPSDRPRGWRDRLVYVVDRTRERAARWLEPIVIGFQEHGWSGKLFLLATGGSIAASVLSYVGAFVMAAIRGAPVLALTPMIVFGALGLPVVWMQWRFLRAIARFKRWARWVAATFSGIGTLGGALAIVTGAGGVPGQIVAIAECALMLQFTIYFVRGKEYYEANEQTLPSTLAGELEP